MRIFFLLTLLLVSIFTAYAQPAPDPACPEAPTPRLIAGEQGRITPGSSNNVRDAASRNGNRTGTIAGGEVISILEGPVCADGFNWWRVEYSGGTGWTVEGTLEEYWIEPYVPEPPTATPTDAPPPTAVPTSAPASSFEPPLEVVNVLAVDGRARVINDDPNADTITLVVRAEPSRNGGVVAQALEGDILTIIGGPQEADGLRWWQVETEKGSQGWVIEGLVNTTRQRFYERTLLPLCTAEGERVVFRFQEFVASSAPDGSEVCLFDYIYSPEWMTFSQTRFNFNNDFLTSPDGQYYVYADGPLYRLSRDGSERLALTNEVVYWASLSPDGQRVAIATGNTIATFNIDGSRFSTLVTGDDIYAWVEWLSDSQTVVFSAQSDWLDQMGLAIAFTINRINTQEGGLRPVLELPLGFDIHSLALSTANDLLAYSGTQYGLIDGMRGTNPVKFLDLGNSTDGYTEVIKADSGEPVLKNDDIFYALDWTPDGQTLMGYSVRDESSVRIPLATGEVTPYTLSGDALPEEGANWLGWASDTSYLVHTGYGFQIEPEDFGIWEIDVFDATVTRVR